MDSTSLFDSIEQEQKKPYFTFKKIGSEIASVEHLTKMLQSQEVGIRHIFSIENSFTGARVTIDDESSMEAVKKQAAKVIKWSVQTGNVQSEYEYMISIFDPSEDKTQNSVMEKEKDFCKIRFKKVPVAIDSVEKFNVIFEPAKVVRFRRDYIKKNTKIKTKTCLITFKGEPEFARDKEQGFFNIQLKTSTLSMPFTRVGKTIISPPQIIEKGDI